MMLGTAHVMLNIMALIIWLVSPLRFVPVMIAEKLGEMITENQNAAYSLLAWVLVVFFVIPLVIIYVL